MAFSKFIHPQSNRILLFTTSYSRSFEHASNLVSELKKDFPEALDEDIEVREFDNSMNNRIMVIVFNNCKSLPISADYKVAPLDFVALRL